MSFFTVSSSPHISTRETTSRIMLDVIIALIPAGVVSVWMFGVKSLWTILLGIGTAVLTEYLIQKMMNKPVTIGDFSAVVTGMLLAYNLPPGSPWWLAVIGSAIAIALVKHVFGGLGHNFMNPALAARAILLACWPVRMTSWIQPGTDAVSTSTPLALLKASDAVSSATVSGASAAVAEPPAFLDVFIGNIGGTIGEVSSAALLLGAAYLLIRGVINWRIPFFYIASTFVLTFLLNGTDLYQAFYQIFIGGLILGAFFMATDYASSPVMPLGQV
ncbi:MAG TPA: RnfABCDGE type electron transport complex subunit D, partial [Clostridiales bacterium]|nr:RnfABCDGE type electron transport complex subunit D [Clostridiales bacterium]